MKALHVVALAGALVSSASVAQSDPPLSISRHGYFFTGGSFRDTPDGRFQTGQMYVEYFIPERRTHATPLVMFSGGGQSGLNYTGTPDGREGWMQFFVRRGYAVYVLDQPSRARSPHQPEVGAMTRLSVTRVQQQFTAPERYNPRRSFPRSGRGPGSRAIRPLISSSARTILRSPVSRASKS